MRQRLWQAPWFIMDLLIWWQVKIAMCCYTRCLFYAAYLALRWNSWIHSRHARHCSHVAMQNKATSTYWSLPCCVAPTLTAQYLVLPPEAHTVGFRTYLLRYLRLSHYGTIRALLRAETGRFRPPDMLTREAYEAELDEARAVFAQKPDVRVTALSLGLTQAQPTPDSLHTQTEVPKWAAFLNRTVSFPEATSLTPPSMDRKGLVAFLQAHQVHITAPWRETYEVPDISAQPSALVEPTWATTSLAAHAAAQKE